MAEEANAAILIITNFVAEFRPAALLDALNIQAHDLPVSGIGHVGNSVEAKADPLSWQFKLGENQLDVAPSVSEKILALGKEERMNEAEVV